MLALDLDNAVTLRLFYFDNEREQRNKSFWVKLVTGEDWPDVLDAEVLDQYADEHTEKW